MQDYKSLCAAVTIYAFYATLVNLQTHTTNTTAASDFQTTSGHDFMRSARGRDKWLCVRLSVRPANTIYHKSLVVKFQQIYNFGAFVDKDELDFKS